jgi:uncharacterized protein
VNDRDPLGPQAPPSLSDKVAFLSRPESYPEGAACVTAIETHMSWVFVTDRLVYKMKKPVRFPYLDFSTLEARRRTCEESLRLNRRLAADVYLGLVPLTCTDAGLRLGGPGEPVEWLEQMRRLPERMMLDSAVREGRATARDGERLTAVLAGFYARAQPCELDAAAYRARLAAGVRDHARALCDPVLELDTGPIAALAEAQADYLERHSGMLRCAGRCRPDHRGHGDLRPEHVCLSEPPVFIDCLEFNRDLRLLDCVDELSYLGHGMRGARRRP